MDDRRTPPPERTRAAGATATAAVLAATATALVVVLAGCTAATPTGTGAATTAPAAAGSDAASASGASGAADPARASGDALWPAGAGFDYQLGGASPVPDGVTVVARDSTDEPAGAGFDICYVNGFQSQPGAVWPESLLLHDASGGLLVDPGWPDEHLFDTSTPSNREALAELQEPVIDGCAAAGFDAVEFDNLDSYSRSDGALDLDDAVAFATLLVERTHDAGLVAGQKNTAELEARGRDEIGFDFAVVEECDRWDECGAFTDVYGDAVLDIEYTDDLRGSFDDVCAREDTPASTVLRDRDLVPADDPAYVYEHC
jgi:hypothetical protein